MTIGYGRDGPEQGAMGLSTQWNRGHRKNPGPTSPLLDLRTIDHQKMSMRTTAAVFTSDSVNRQNLTLPLAALVASMERQLAAAVSDSMPYGMPANVSHDMCRSLGWSVPRGLYIAKDCARQAGLIYEAETDADRADIAALRKGAVAWSRARQIEPFADELDRRTEGYATEARGFWHGEAAAALEPGLAAGMFPQLFDPASSHVDKDGLVDFDFLLSLTRQIHPGVFYESKRDIVLFAHRFFRRSLSRDNTLNDYLLRSFTDAAETPGVVGRLRLDPDLVGHPGSARSKIELEYWHGPHYDDDIAAIPDGVAEHKSSDNDRLYSGIDKTQIWWKAPEIRGGSPPRQIRTFEVEELIEDESPGLAEGEFGCRYAHAEYDLADRTISHFDGAIRAYGSDAYLKRVEKRIDRAGKHAQYTKLFRLDGQLPVESWKQVLTDWYLGNTLIPEYLGAATEPLPDDEPVTTALPPAVRPELAAFLCLEKDGEVPPSSTQLVADQSMVLEGKPLAFAEVGSGVVRELMREWLGPETNAMAGRSDYANLALVHLGSEAVTAADWGMVAQRLANALAAAEEQGQLQRVTVAVAWSTNGIKTTLSIEGPTSRVAALLDDARTIVDPSRPAENWSEPFRDALLQQAPELAGPVDWPGSAARTGRLAIEHQEDLEFELWMHGPDR